jgi:hypothetical protein
MTTPIVARTASAPTAPMITGTRDDFGGAAGGESCALPRSVRIASDVSGRA